MSTPHLSWTWVLVVYLWATGGVGWTNAYQLSTQRRMKLHARVIAYALWPIFSFVAMCGEWYAHLFPPRRL